MTHSLTLEIPENIYEPLVKTAMQRGETPEALAVLLLAAATQSVVDDPLEPFIGAFSSSIPDWADQHDKYPGQQQ